MSDTTDEIAQHGFGEALFGGRVAILAVKHVEHILELLLKGLNQQTNQCESAGAISAKERDETRHDDTDSKAYLSTCLQCFVDLGPGWQHYVIFFVLAE